MKYVPRAWQRRALIKWQNLGEPSHFFLEACPGAGKTLWSLDIATRLVVSGKATLIVVVVPTKVVKMQFAMSAARGFGINLNTHVKSDRPPGNDYQGVVVTYSQLVKLVENNTLARWRKAYTFVSIFDEVHHCDVLNPTPWGQAAESLAEVSNYVIASSGTPFRSVGEVPFLDDCRNEDQRFSIGYGEALQQRRPRCVREVGFHFDDSEWFANVRDENGQIVREMNGNASDSSTTEKYHAIFNPKNDWISETILRVDHDLNVLRQTDPDAGCLFVCRPGKDSKNPDGHADSVRKRIEELTGCTPTLVRYKDPSPGDLIDKFRDDHNKYIVAVRMVSEGVDIKRLRTLVICTPCETELMFRQMIGRIVRWQEGHGSGQDGHVYLPEFPHFLLFAKRIRDEIEEYQRQLKERSGDDDDDDDDGGSQCTMSTDSNRGLESYVYDDIETNSELSEKALSIHQAGKCRDMSINAIVEVLSALQDNVVDIGPAETEEQKKVRYRKEGDKWAKRCYYQNRDVYDSHNDVYIAVNRLLGVKSVDDLHDNKPSSWMKQRRDILKSWVEQGPPK